MDVLPPGWQDIGAQGLVVLFVLLIFLGWMIPRSTVLKQIAVLESRISDKDEQIRDLREANDRMLNALQDLTVTAHTGPIALRSIQQQAEKAGDE